jgi:predicted Zn-dependent protease
MAKSLRNYDRDDVRAAQAAAPLIAEYPENATFLLLVGDLEQKLGHKDEAAERFRAAAAAASEDNACTARAQQLAREALATLGVE